MVVRRLLPLLLALFLAAPAARAAVAFDVQGAADCFLYPANTSLTCASFMNVGSGGSTTNLALVVEVVYSAAPGTVSVTWNGTAVPAVNSVADASGDTAAFYCLANPATGSRTLKVTTTNSVGIYMDAVSYSGADQTTPCQHFASTSGGACNNCNKTVSITSAAADAVVGVGGADTASATIPAGTVQVFTDGSSINNGWGTRNPGAAGSASMSATLNSPNGNFVFAGVDVVAAPSAGCAAHHLSLLGVGC